MPDGVAERPRSRMVLSPLVVACLAATWIIWGSGYLAIRVTLTGFNSLAARVKRPCRVTASKASNAERGGSRMELPVTATHSVRE
jgi:hypothetical protein